MLDNFVNHWSLAKSLLAVLFGSELQSLRWLLINAVDNDA